MSTTAQTDHSRWFFCPRPRPTATVRLFCFPYAGSGASVFHGWQEAFGAEIEVQGVVRYAQGAEDAELTLKRINLVEPFATVE